MSEHEHHNHENGPDENVRMDILKVNQKIFNQYPVGSPERKVCIRNKKLMELEALTATMNHMPPESVGMVSTMNLHLVIFAALKAGACILGLAAVPFLWNWMGNVTGQMALSCVAAVVVIFLVDNLMTGWKIYNERRDMLNAYKSVKAKFEALIKDLEQLN